MWFPTVVKGSQAACANPHLPETGVDRGWVGHSPTLILCPGCGISWRWALGSLGYQHPAHSTFLGAAPCPHSGLQDAHWYLSAAETRGNHLLELWSVLELCEAKLGVHSNLLEHCLGSQGWIILSKGSVTLCLLLNGDSNFSLLGQRTCGVWL